ncbi:DUF2332 domain-containing protein [Sphingomonas sp. RS6]
MNMPMPRLGAGELARQARFARDLGSPFIAEVLDAGHRQLRRGSRTEATIMGWPTDPAASALAMRFNAALHLLARRGTPALLAALYRGEHTDFDEAVGEALAREDSFIARFLCRTPQTNEVGRAASIVAALMQVHRRFGMPFELLELGSSAGLNLNLGRYAYDLGGVKLGDPASDVIVAPEWRGKAPEQGTLEVVGACGVDLNPLDPTDPATCERLMAYIWADQPLRLARLDRALAMARRFPPEVDCGDATAWLPAQLALPQPAGVCRVVMHSMVLQYLPAAAREIVTDTIHEAARAATSERPLAWVGFEWTPTRSEVRLSLSYFPGGEDRRVLGICHPYGNWVDWRG